MFGTHRKLFSLCSKTGYPGDTGIAERVLRSSQHSAAGAYRPSAPRRVERISCTRQMNLKQPAQILNQGRGGKPGPFSGHGPTRGPRIETGRLNGCSKPHGLGRVGSGSIRTLTVWVGSGPVGSGRVGSGGFQISPVEPGRTGRCSHCMGSGRFGSGRVGSGPVGSGRVGSGRVRSGAVGSGDF